MRRQSAQLRIAPVSLAEARAFVARHHRHNPAPVGHKFSLAIMDTSGIRRGVAIVGRPVARSLDDGQTLEVTRVCTDGTANACSALLGAAWRAARELGFRRLITYTQTSETGASLRGAGWTQVAEIRPRAGWTSQGRPRQDKHPTRVRRRRWQVTTADFTQFRHTPPTDRDETPPRAACLVCTAPIEQPPTGRRPRYCSHACRQAAYRTRTTAQNGKTA
ncbi:XF1762 family protein [Salinispora arenicola]|uniref:XF1762 family protein n=1 Tax=Salinispora arenicola TaxID=168697 RepID=UPI0003828A27|nr:XF1762 family protein [Salinispora arenicola]